MLATARRRAVALTALLLTLGATALLLGLGSAPAEAEPIPSPLYSVIATSNGHTASVLNLPLGQPGLPQIPTPVDVDGDLLPDVTVTINLVEVGGVVNNPPDPVSILQPNLNIDRLLTTPLLGQSSPPLRIEAKLRLLDTDGGPTTDIRFGYDTGAGGSIPPTFKATLGGLTQLFNPLSAVVDTGPSAGRPVSYDGPLRLVGGITTGDTAVDLGFGFSPFPHRLALTYLDDAEAQHLTYSHSAPREVDLRAEVDLVDPEGELHVDARVERLPGSIAVDIAKGGSDRGAITWASDSDGRRPDVDVHIESIGNGDDDEPLVADVDLDSLPQDISAAWALPEEGPSGVTFDASGQGIGGVDIDVRNHLPDTPGALPRFVPTEQQFLSIHQAAGPDGDVLSRISGRVERVRHVAFSDTGDDVGGVLEASVSMGDGELPLQLSYDCRVECSEDGTLRLADVDATVAPLPDDFSVVLTDAGSDERAAPMVVDYTASQPADVDASVRMAGPGSSGASIACATVDTTCADLALRDLPTELTATIGRYLDDEQGDTRLTVDFADDSVPPDLTAHVALGAGPDEPDQPPLVVDAEALDLPAHARFYMHERFDDVAGELVLDRAAFHACARAVNADACDAGTEGEIGALAVSMRSFVDRPAGFPLPLHDQPQYATVTSRPNGLEVGARAEHVRNLEYVDTGTVQGVLASAGDGVLPFTTRIDIEGASLGDEYELEEGVFLQDPTRDLRADAVVSTLPPTFSVCFRTPNEVLEPAGEPFTVACEQSELAGDPLAFAYSLDVDQDDDVRVEGTFATTLRGELNGTEHAETMAGEATVPDVPTDVLVHASLPDEDTVGPVDAVYLASSQLDIDFEATKAVNDSRCLDPRPTASAMCVSAYIDEIPQEARIHYDPTDLDDNLLVTTSGPGMSLLDIDLSSVAPRAEPIDEPFPTPESLVVTGRIEGLPGSVRGTIVLPKEDGDGNTSSQLGTTVVVCASTEPCDEAGPTDDRIGHVVLDARNVVVADPTPLGELGGVPGPRNTGYDPVTDEILLFQRGQAFHAFLDIAEVGAVGYRQVSDDEGNRLDTDELLLRFGEGADPVIRAYVDLDLGTSRTIADVVLADVPASTRFCFRGKNTHVGVEPADPTWCDDPDNALPTEGAVQLATVPGTSASGLDVDAFLRQTAGGDATGLAARLRIVDLPPVLQGTVPADGRGSLDIAGYVTEGGAAAGIGGLQFEAASFDLEDHGFATVPWSRTIGPLNTDEFPAPSLAGQHLSAVITNDGFHARGRLDGLRRIALRDGLCEGSDDLPDDYPAYPEPAPGTQPYTCARVEVVDGAAGQPFNVRAVARDGVDLVSLTDAGLTALPRSFQFTLAEGDPLGPGPGQPLRDVCTSAPDPDCVPPLIRVDIDGDESQLFGTMRMGSDDHLDELEQVDPRGGEFGGLSYADLDSSPTLGARVRVGTWSDEPGYPDVEPGAAVIARFRLPLPASLQIDPPQTWSDASPNVDDPEWEATDLRMHYVARDADGDVIDSLGDLKVLVHSAPSGKQILLSGGLDIVGTQIPGEMALAVYLRDDKVQERMFAQIDGLVSTDMSLSATILPGMPPLFPLAVGGEESPPPDRIALQVLNIPASDEPFASWEEPGFRVQAEIVDDSPPPDPCSATSCSESESGLKEVRAMIDLHPNAAEPPARLLQAVVRTLAEGPMGVQFAGFQDVHASGTDGGGFDADGDALVSLRASLTLDPLYVYTFEGVPFLANYSVEIDATMDVGITVDEARNFQLFNDAVGMVTNYDGEASAYLGPIALRPELMYVDVTFLGTTVFGLEAPYYNLGDVLPLEFPSCSGGDLAGEILFDQIGGGAAHIFLDNLPWENYPGATDDAGYGKEVGQGRSDILVWPKIADFPGDQGLVPIGAGVLADLLPGIGHAIGCGIGDLDEVDLITPEHPGVPSGLSGSVLTDHPVPGESPSDNNPPTYQEPPDPFSEQTLSDVELCGRQSYPGHLIVSGTVTVADEAGAFCPAGQEGRLELVAETIVVDGTIDADEIIDVDCDAPNFGTYNYDNDDATNPIFAQAISDLTDPSTACDQYVASGAGAGHFGNGGFGGTAFGVPYDTRDQAGLATAGWAGGHGSVPGGGGHGGGYVRLVATEVDINGTITANGDDGNHAAEDCTGLQLGSGGGSGGGIVVLANRIRFGGAAALSADGGDGGNGAAAGGGGGAAGDIELVSGIIDPAAPKSALPGSGGDELGCGVLDGGDGSFLGGGHEEATQRSHAVPFGAGPAGNIWFTTNDIDRDRDGTFDDTDTENEVEVRVPFAASANSPNGMTVALCGVALSPDIVETERAFRLLTPDYASPSDPCGLADIAGIARVETARLIAHEYLPDTHVSAFDGFTLDIEDLTANPDWCPSFLPQSLQDEICGVEPVSAYYGLYTVTIRSDTPGNDCLEIDPSNLFEDVVACWKYTPGPNSDPSNDCTNPLDGFVDGGGLPWQAGARYDALYCIYPNVELPPGDAGPDVIIGLDNDEPEVLAVAPDYYDQTGQADDRGTADPDDDIVWTRRHRLSGSLQYEDRLGDTAIVNTSGVEGFECFERTPGQAERAVTCDRDGTFEARLSPTDGRKELFFRVFDVVGNSSELAYDDVVVDTVIPTSIIALDPAVPDQPNDWYTSGPEMTISGFTDPAPDSLEAGPHPDNRYRLQIDDGTEIACNAPDPGPGPEACVAPITVGDGLHDVWYTAVDRAGNRGRRGFIAAILDRSMNVEEIGVDDDPPVTGVQVAPPVADGANDWWITPPYIGVTANDLPVGGAGVDPTLSPSRLDVSVTGPGFPAGYVEYEGPILLGEGGYDVCAKGRDTADNPDPGDPESIDCQFDILVDSIAPTVLLPVAGPLGAGGWHTGPTTVSPSAFDVGSGIDPLTAPSGLFVSVDGGPYLPDAGPVVLGEGEHVVRAYAVDVAGNRSPIAEQVVLVDRSRPVSAARTSPPAPAQNGWYRTTPTITLKATDGDENAGASSIVWCTGSGCTPSTTYTGPFTVPAGSTVLRWRALDVSGAANHEAIRQLTVKADTAPPTAKATLPSPIIWSRTLANLGLGPTAVTLRWTVGDDRSGPLRVTVVVFDTFGTAVRRLDAGVVNAPPGSTLNGQTMWDGRNDTLSGLVPIGVYHYRVVVTDDAGNVAESGESRLITIKLL